MKLFLLALYCAVLTGCAVNRPQFIHETYDPQTGLIIERRRLVVPSIVTWPATQSIEKQKASLGKTFSLGQTAMEQESGGTNVVEALKAIDSILGKIR